MKKLRLNLDELEVESFETEAEHAERGTVHGHAQYSAYCPPGESLQASNCPTCQQTCVATCYGQNTCEGVFTCGPGSTCLGTCDPFNGCNNSWAYCSEPMIECSFGAPGPCW